MEGVNNFCNPLVVEKLNFPKKDWTSIVGNRNLYILAHPKFEVVGFEVEVLQESPQHFLVNWTLHLSPMTIAVA
jgi:hypothetical protein